MIQLDGLAVRDFVSAAALELEIVVGLLGISKVLQFLNLLAARCSSFLEIILFVRLESSRLQLSHEMAVLLHSCQ